MTQRPVSRDVINSTRKPAGPRGNGIAPACQRISVTPSVSKSYYARDVVDPVDFAGRLAGIAPLQGFPLLVVGQLRLPAHLYSIRPIFTVSVSR
jgi:hypothetical protein